MWQGWSASDGCWIWKVKNDNESINAIIKKTMTMSDNLQPQITPAASLPYWRDGEGCPLSRSVASPLMAVAWNLILVYIIYFIARVEYLLVNLDYFRQSIGEGSLLRLFWGGTVLDTPGIMYTNALWILLILLPLQWKERRGYQRMLKWLFIVVNAVALAANLADSVYFRYTLRRTSSEVFGGFAGEDILGRVMGVEVLHHWYLVVLAALLLWLLWRLYFTPRIEVDRQPPLKYYAVQMFSLVVGALMCVSGIRGGLLNHWYQYLIAIIVGYIAVRLLRNKRHAWIGVVLLIAAITTAITAPVGGFRHRDIRPVALSSAAAYANHPTETALVLNTPFSVIRTIGKSVFNNPGYFSSEEELEKIYTPIHNENNNDNENVNDNSPLYTLHSTPPNVVVIIIESFGREYIGALNHEVLPGYEGYTPFTDSLIQHSATWRYSFCNGRKSIDGMPSILSSIPMFVKPFVLTPQGLNRVTSIASHLRTEGYQTAFFHGARTGSMGFNAFAHSIGYEKYYGREDFNNDSRFGGDADFDGYWAIWDEPFMQYFALTMSEMREPFTTALFTASSHHPFRIPEKYADRFEEGELPIHKCIRYTDNALRQFFNTARQQPWFENTIFVITSDHTNMSAYDEYRSDIGGFCSPIIIYSPSGDIEPGMREGIAQQIDIMPTVLGLLGYRQPYCAFGIDLFTTPADDTWAVNYLNGTYQYVSSGYVLQFDGKKTTALYRLGDWKMEHNIIGTVPEQDAMELKLKAIIQQYMLRITENRLTAE